ncbi:hypothetical protein EGW08_009699 [Elysia chlorotica]|uniref:Uncharacterized protein n=1 Tax=Elysia chlorotica TaxID=188477 RepID=A0A433TLR0_ELYCH|nr:hypothetical protein EGW08_009699 [Elysia chlorotica]
MYTGTKGSRSHAPKWREPGDGAQGTFSFLSRSTVVVHILKKCVNSTRAGDFELSVNDVGTYTIVSEQGTFSFLSRSTVVVHILKKCVNSTRAGDFELSVNDVGTYTIVSEQGTFSLYWQDRRWWCIYLKNV